MMSAATKRLTAAIDRRLRAIADRFRRPAKEGVIRDSKQMAQYSGLSHPALSGLPTGRGDSAAVVKEHRNKPDSSPEHAKATLACLPIGPSCC
jgi:hypothetical protein